MNMRSTFPEFAEEIDHLSLHPLKAPKPLFDAERIAGLAITILLHIVVIAAFIYGGLHVTRAVTPKAVTVSLAETKPAEPPPVLPPPKLLQPQVETIAPPDVVIATNAPPPITIQTQDKPVTNPPPPQPVAAETQASYLSRVLAHLNTYKRYPSEARRAKIQGVVMLHFVMDKDGKVVTFDLAKTSGRPALDQEALALIQRAQPLPPIPPSYGKDQLNAVVPIEFSLR